MIDIFRAWDKNEGRMIYSEESDYPFSWTIGNYGIEILEHDGTDWNVLRNLEIMQYIGLEDKNGVKIFEGDIIRTHFNLDNVTQEPFVIIWNEEKAMFVGEKQANAIDDYFNTFSFFPEQRFIYEVIGNIHGNPELLEEKK